MLSDSLQARRDTGRHAQDGIVCEAVLFGLAKLWGRATGFKLVEDGIEARSCLRLCTLTCCGLRQTYLQPYAGKELTLRDLVALQSRQFSSSSELLAHRDFGIFAQDAVPGIRLIMCLRPDRARVVETLVIDMRCASSSRMQCCTLPHSCVTAVASQRGAQGGPTELLAVSLLCAEACQLAGR